MNNQEKFIGICFDRKLAGKTYKEWLPIYEQKLQKKTYRQDNAADYLNNVVGLSTLYSRLNLWSKMEKLADQLEGLVDNVREHENEATYVATFLKSNINREYRQSFLLKDSLKQITEL